MLFFIYCCNIGKIFYFIIVMVNIIIFLKDIVFIVVLVCGKIISFGFIIIICGIDCFWFIVFWVIFFWLDNIIVVKLSRIVKRF